MGLALSLGRRGQGRVWPNPAVGCVIVNAGRLVGRGWTQDGGRPHAEPMALAQAGAAASGATAYVTLEPCAHTGQTPPCAQALIDAGLSQVVVAHVDPDARVAGKGIKMLQAAGIRVVTDICADQARQDHQGFLRRIEHGLPMVTLKLAMSCDGRIATAAGESQWITGPQARRFVHAMRARHDAVMVGAGTARADLPSLTVRGQGATRQPVRVVLSRGLDLPQTGPLFETAHDVPVWLVHGAQAGEAAKSAWQSAGAKLITGNGSVTAALGALAGAGLTRVFCEGGGQMAAALLEADLVDRLVVFTAGLALGAEGAPGVAALQARPLANIPRFELQSQTTVGQDVMQIWQNRAN